MACSKDYSDDDFEVLPPNDFVVDAAAAAAADNDDDEKENCSENVKRRLKEGELFSEFRQKLTARQNQMLDGLFEKNFKDQRLAKVEELTEFRKEEMVKRIKQSHKNLDDMVIKMEELTKKLQMIIEAEANENNYKHKNSEYSDDDFEVLPLDADDVENEVPNFMAPVSDNAAFGARKKNSTDTKASFADVEEEGFEIISRSEIEKDCPEIEELTMEGIKKELADMPQAEIGEKMKTRAKHLKKQTLDKKVTEKRLRNLEKQLEENEKKVAKKSVMKEKSRKKHDSISDSFEFIGDDEIEEAKAKH